MGIIAPVLPTLGGPRGDGEAAVRDALNAAINEMNGHLNGSNLIQSGVLALVVDVQSSGDISLRNGTANQVAVGAIGPGPGVAFDAAGSSGLYGDGAGVARVKGTLAQGGKKNTPGAESTSSTSFVKLATADEVTVVLPTDGLIKVLFQAIWQNTVASNARAAIFLGSNQLKVATATGAPAVQEATGGASTNDDDALYSSGSGLQSGGGAGATTEVTTGQVLGVSGGVAAGAAYIFAAAGTYVVSIQFKNNAAGTLTVKNRHLWVAAEAY